MTLSTRAPSGATPWPVVLVEGEDLAECLVQSLALSASTRVARTLVFCLGDLRSAADRHADVGEFEVVQVRPGPKQSTWEALVAAVAEAVAVDPDADGHPTAIVVHSASALQAWLLEWIDGRARKGKAIAKVLDDDEDAAFQIPHNLWADLDVRHRQLMGLLRAHNGPVVLTALGTPGATVDELGRPVAESAAWRVLGHKTLTTGVDAWVRLHRHPARAVLIAADSQLLRLPGDGPLPLDGMDDRTLLDRLVFDRLAPADGFTSTYTPARAKEILLAAVNESGVHGKPAKDEARDRWAAAGLEGTTDPLTADEIADLIAPLVQAPANDAASGAPGPEDPSASGEDPPPAPSIEEEGRPPGGASSSPSDHDGDIPSFVDPPPEAA